MRVAVGGLAWHCWFPFPVLFWFIGSFSLTVVTYCLLSKEQLQFLLTHKVTVINV